MKRHKKDIMVERITKFPVLRISPKTEALIYFFD